MSAFTAGGAENEKRMSLVGHLTELRNRIFISAIAIAVFSVFGFWVSDRVLGWLSHYYQNALGDPTAKTSVFGPLEGIGIKLKIASYVGLFGSSPVWLWQAWRFVTPGLKAKEKRYAIPFLLSSVGLFLLGGAVGIITLPAGLKFLVQISGKNLNLIYGTKDMLQFVTIVVLAFGFSFLFPVVLVFLELVNLVTPKQLLKGWRHAIVVIFVIAAVITPSQDPFTLFGMAGPMVLFYFGAIAIGRLAKK